MPGVKASFYFKDCKTMQLRLKEESGPIIRFIDFKEHRIEYFSGKFI